MNSQPSWLTVIVFWIVWDCSETNGGTTRFPHPSHKKDYNMNVYELNMLANSLASENVVITINGDIAYACQRDGKFIINLPVPINKDEEDMLFRGYLDHELGHVKFTNMVLYERTDVYFKDILNILEDVYIERLMGASYPGSKLNLHRLACYVFTPEHVTKALERATWSTYVQLFVLYNRRVQLDPELGHSLERIHYALINAGFKAKALQQAYTLLETKTYSTQDNALLAAKLYYLLKDNYIPQENKQQTLAEGEILETQPMTTEEAFDSAFQQKLNGLSNDENFIRDSVKKAIDSDMKEVPLDENDCVVHSLPHSLYGSLSRSIPPFLQSMQYVPARVGRKGQLIGNRLWRTSIADDRVFLRNGMRNVKEVEVIILMDCSTSMLDYFNTMLDATHAIYAMLKTLSKVKSQVYGFTGATIQQARLQRNVLYSPPCSGSTGTGDAMLFCLQKYNNKPDVRKIMFLLTDGLPNNADLLNCALHLYKQCNVETYGIGMQGMDLGHWFDKDHYVVVDNMNRDLAPMMGAMMKKALVCANTRP